jgi:hypothetical protein
MVVERLTCLAEDLGGGQPVLGVRHAGAALDVIAIVDAEEISRRRAFGLGPVTDPLIVEACADLPLGLPVPMCRLDPFACLVLDGSPPGLVQTVGNSIIRLWRPAVDVVAVTVSCSPRRWLSSLGRVSTAVGLGDRYVLVGGSPVPSALLSRADRLGVGVVQASTGEFPTILARPAPRSLRPGAERWAFLEAAYAALVMSLRGSSPKPAVLGEARTARPSVVPTSQRR